MDDGKDEDGVALLQNAMAAGKLSDETDAPVLEMAALDFLVCALFKTLAIDEVRKEKTEPRTPKS